MCLFARAIEHALNVPIERLHDADARKHRRAAERRHQDQRFHRRLPFRKLVNCLRKLGDVIAGIFERVELATIRSSNSRFHSVGRIFENSDVCELHDRRRDLFVRIHVNEYGH